MVSRIPRKSIRLVPRADSISGLRPNLHDSDILKGNAMARVSRIAGRMEPNFRSSREEALPITKIASTLGGGGAIGLAAAVLVPSLPLVAIAAAAVGAIGSGLLIHRYG